MKFKPKYEAKNIVLHLRVRSYLNYHNAETNGTNVWMHAIFPSNRIVYKWPCKTEVFFFSSMGSGEATSSGVYSGEISKTESSGDNFKK